MTLSKRSIVYSLFGGLACLVLAAGCDSPPTYPKERLAESLQELLTGDHLDASVRFIDHTLAVQLNYPDALSHTGDQVGLGPAFDDATHKALTATHRVLLSTDAQIDFYVLLMSDPHTPGVYLTIVRYVDDIKRANANMLDTPEMFARTIFEVNYVGSASLTLEEYVPREIRLEEFLSWQLARRIQHALSDELQVSGTSAMVGRCGGKFENGQFVFSLDVNPTTEGQLNEETMQKVFQTSTNIVAKVLSNYRFESFDSVRLIHPLTGRNIVLPKARLELFR